MMIRALVVALAVIASAACVHHASSPPYVAAKGQGPGFSEVQLGEGRYHVAFRGDADTPRETTQIYLFHRAAELTLALGYDTFTTLAQDVGQSTAGPHTGFYDRVPTRSYPHNLYGMVVQFEPRLERSASELHPHFLASVEIVMTRGKVPGQPGVFDARDVLAALKDRVLQQ